MLRVSFFGVTSMSVDVHLKDSGSWGLGARLGAAAAMPTSVRRIALNFMVE
jgi:hypothetical protein